MPNNFVNEFCEGNRVEFHQRPGRISHTIIMVFERDYSHPYRSPFISIKQRPPIWISISLALIDRRTPLLSLSRRFLFIKWRVA